MTELIAFFSRGDENYVDGEIKTLETGNTEVVAGVIQKLTGAELFKIEPLEEYSKDYNECIAQAQSDQMQNVLPELKAYPESMKPFILVFPITGERCRWRYLRFWNILISQARLSGLSVHMRGAEWRTAYMILLICVLMQRWKKGL